MSFSGRPKNVDRFRSAEIGVYTSHNMREVEEMCDWVAFLARGRMVTQGTPQEVIARAQTVSLEEVFISIAREGQLRDVAASKEHP
jgi:ABC-2 type transport system ATP-binding protein